MFGSVKKGSHPSSLIFFTIYTITTILLAGAITIGAACTIWATRFIRVETPGIALITTLTI
jgi:hypothetical protein